MRAFGMLSSSWRWSMPSATSRSSEARPILPGSGPPLSSTGHSRPSGRSRFSPQPYARSLDASRTVLDATSGSGGLLVMSGVKSGAFVDHAEEVDRAPQPDSRIPRGQFWLPDNDYIRAKIVARASAQSRPWGELTYFGRPVVVKTEKGQRLVLNVAQPEAEPPLTGASLAARVRETPLLPHRPSASVRISSCRCGGCMRRRLSRFTAATDLIRQLSP